LSIAFQVASDKERGRTKRRKEDSFRRIRRLGTQVGTRRNEIMRVFKEKKRESREKEEIENMTKETGR